MRIIKLNIVLPADITQGIADTVSAEIWDASLSDVPAVLLSSTQLKQVALCPNGELKAELTAPDDVPQQTLIARVHVSMDGSRQIKPGDFFSTRFTGIPHKSGHEELSVPVERIRDALI